MTRTMTVHIGLSSVGRYGCVRAGAEQTVTEGQIQNPVPTDCPGPDKVV